MKLLILILSIFITITVSAQKYEPSVTRAGTTTDTFYESYKVLDKY